MSGGQPLDEPSFRADQVARLRTSCTALAARLRKMPDTDWALVAPYSRAATGGPWSVGECAAHFVGILADSVTGHARTTEVRIEAGEAWTPAETARELQRRARTIIAYFRNLPAHRWTEVRKSGLTIFEGLDRLAFEAWVHSDAIATATATTNPATCLDGALRYAIEELEGRDQPSALDDPAALIRLAAFATPTAVTARAGAGAIQSRSIPYARVGVMLTTSRWSATIARRYSSQSGCSPDERAVERDQLLHRRVARIRGRRCELGLPFEHDEGPEVVAAHVERRSRIAPEVLGLGPVGGDRDPGGSAVVERIDDVRDLGPAVAPDGREHALPLRAGERRGPSRVPCARPYRPGPPVEPTYW